MKRFRRILAIGCVLCIIVTSTVICLAATVRAPKPDGQNKSLWCWATAAKLVAENNGGAWIDSTAAVLSDTNGLHSGPRDNVPYYGVNANGAYTADGVQRSIVMYVKGSDGNLDGVDSDKEAALSYAANSSVSVGTFGYYLDALSSYDIQSIKDDLASGKYLIGNLYIPATGKGHSVVMKSYNASTDKYRILDPWDRTDTYYSSSIFSSASFPISTHSGQLTWIQYCR